MMEMEIDKPTRRPFSMYMEGLGLQLCQPPPSVYMQVPNLGPLPTIYKNGVWYYKPDYKKFKSILRCSKENRVPVPAKPRYIKIYL